MRRFITPIAILGVLASGCTTGIGKAAPTPSPGQESPAATASVTLSAASPDAWLLVGKKGSDMLEVIRASTQEQMLELPMGVPTGTDWSRMVVATAAVGNTTVRDLTVQPGLGGRQTTVDGAWQLPTIGYDPTPVGLSADGSTVVLIEARPASASAITNASTSARFAVLRLADLDQPPRIIQLPGNVEYDAVSPDGDTLYVVEHLSGEPAGRYQVRAVDVTSGSLKDGVIADKRGLVEPMAGWPLAQVRRADGGVFTLYRSDEHPFIHALDTVTGTAVCIDLPATGVDDADAALDWGLAPTSDGASIYAVNATLGLVIEVDPTQLAIRRSVSVKALAAGGIVLAKVGHIEGGPVARRSIVAPDGRTLYAAGAGGILAIATSDLSVRGRFLDGQAVDTLGVTADGGELYALLGSGGRIVKLDASSGEMLGEVPGAGYDRLFAVVPW